MSEEKNPLVVIQPSEIALAQGQYVGGESWGDDDEEVKPRYLRIKQSKTPDADGVDDGLFWDKETGETWDSLEMVAFGVRKTRKLKTPYNPGKPSETLCRSANRKVPVTTDDRFTPKAVNCDVCAYGERAWANYKKDKIKPANPCDMEIEFVFIISSNPTQPYILVGTGKGRDPLEKMYDKIRARSKSIGGQTGRRPELFEYEITLTTAPGETPTTKEFYYPVYEVNELSAEEAQAKYGAAYQVYVNARTSAFDAAQSQATDEAVQEASTERIVETEAKVESAAKPRAEYKPPVSRRKAGDAVRPTYKAPATIDGATGETVTP